MRVPLTALTALALAACGARAALPVGENADASVPTSRAPFPCIGSPGPEVRVTGGPLATVTGAISDDGERALLLGQRGDGVATGVLLDLRATPWRATEVVFPSLRGRVAPTREGFVHFDADCALIVLDGNLDEVARDETTFANCDLRRAGPDELLVFMNRVGGNTLYARRPLSGLTDSGPFRTVPLAASDMAGAPDGTVFAVALYPDSGRAVFVRAPRGEGPESVTLPSNAGEVRFGPDPRGEGVITLFPSEAGIHALARVPSEGPLELESLEVEVAPHSHLGATDDEIVAWPGDQTLLLLAGTERSTLDFFDRPVREALPLFRTNGVEGGVLYVSGDEAYFRGLVCHR